MNGWQLIEFYAAPDIFAKRATAANWSELVHTAREYGVLASLHPKLQTIDFAYKKSVESHVISSVRFANKQYQTLVKELLELEPVFSDCGYPVLLVKGSAYRLAGFDYARYRLFSDIDILVGKAHFQDAVKRLHDFGFIEQVESEYERDYYIQWSHQYPPLRHFMRNAEIDLHHTIFFAKSRVTVDIDAFIKQSTPIQHSVFSLPSTAHMFVHACLHLFYQEESQKLAKDLIDLHCLYQQIDHKNDIVRAADICNERAAIGYGLMVQQWLFKQTLSDVEHAFIKKHCHARQLKSIRIVLTALLKPNTLAQFCANIVWVMRGHLIKMNLRILSYHFVMRLINQYKKNKRHSLAQKQIDQDTLPEDAR